jgi:hypothetical protein
MAASFGKIVPLPHVRAGVSVPLGETTGGERVSRTTIQFFWRANNAIVDEM